MNERYPDALAEEIAREDVCIICREVMRPWRQANVNTTAQENENAVASGHVQGIIDERLRPKKLPCGHILHFACLRSWLERQQNCPTCRSPVLTPSGARGQALQQQNPQVRAQNQLNAANDAAALQGHGQPGGAPNRVRVFNFGPFRLGFGAGHDVQGAAQQMNNVQAQNPQTGPSTFTGDIRNSGDPRQLHQPTVAPFSPTVIQMQLQNIEQQLMQQIHALRAQADQLYMVRALQGELARIRIAQASQVGEPNPNVALRGLSIIYGSGANQANSTATPDSHRDLPPGLTIPEGWTLMPLQQIAQTDTPFPIATDLFQHVAGQGMTSSPPPNHQDPSTDPSISADHSRRLQNDETVPSPNSKRPHSTPLILPVEVPSDQGLDSASANSRSSKGIPSHTRKHAPASDLAQNRSIPRWGSGPFEPGTTSTQMAGSTIPKSMSSESRETKYERNTSGTGSSGSKGKGRAVTVEDDVDDASEEMPRPC